jgi:hypothetical protein
MLARVADDGTHDAALDAGHLHEWQVRSPGVVAWLLVRSCRAEAEDGQAPGGIRHREQAAPELPAPGYLLCGSFRTRSH